MAVRNVNKVNQALKADATEKRNANEMRINRIEGLFNGIRDQREDIIDGIDTFTAIRSLPGAENLSKFSSNNVYVSYSSQKNTQSIGLYHYRDGYTYYIEYDPKNDDFHCWWNGYGMCSEWHYKTGVRSHDDLFIETLEDLFTKVQAWYEKVFDFSANL